MARKLSRLSTAELTALKAAKEAKIAELRIALQGNIRNADVRAAFENTVTALNEDVRRIDAQIEKVSA